MGPVQVGKNQDRGIAVSLTRERWPAMNDGAHLPDSGLASEPDANLGSSATTSTLPLVLTPKEAAQLLRAHPNTLYDLLARGELPHVQVGRQKRIPRWGLLAWLARESGSPLPEDEAL
jgi:excisionase family DNA binding protein